MAEPDYDGLARAHMAQQVKDVAVVQALLGRVWDQTMDPNDLKGSFEKFQRQASAIIKQGRMRGELTAQQYYSAVRLLAGYTDPLPDVPLQPSGDAATRRALQATGFRAANKALREGTNAEAAMALAKAAMLRSAKRRTLEAGRNRLVALSEKDKNVDGWTRVSDGKPCYFCAMLVSRGPVYTSGTVGFIAHDGCGCNVRPVFKNDRSGGWSADAREYEKRWEDEGSDLALFRSAHNLATGRTSSRRLTLESLQAET